MSAFIDFDQNSVKPALLANNLDDYRILQELYDHRILVKFFLDLIIILHDIDDHGIIVKIFIEFNQNSVSQPYYITIQMTIEFFNNSNAGHKTAEGWFCVQVGL